MGLSLPKRWLPLFAAASVMLVTLVFSRYLERQERELTERRVELQTVNLREAVHSAINQQVLALVRMARRWEALPPSRARWETDAALMARHVAYQAIEWADSSFRVQWVVPPEGNEAAAGLDLLFEPRHREVVESARESRQARISHTIELVQGEKGFLIAVPLFVGGEFDGLILGVLRIRQLLDGILDRNRPLSAYDVTVRDGEQEIFRRSLGNEAKLCHESTLATLGLEWHVSICTQRFFPRQITIPRILLTAGTVAGLLLALAVYLAQSAQQRVAQVEEARRELESEIAERRRAERALEQARSELESRVETRTASLREANERLASEVQERERAQGRLQLLVRELDHRVKNTLAIVRAIAEQTIGNAGSLAEFNEAFHGRIGALARIHAALADKQWDGPPLRQLVEMTAAPYATDADSLSLQTDDLIIPPDMARVLGMALHELATNAAKYGAFSVPGGHVDVSGERRDSAGHSVIRITWRESGGPTVTSPAKRGLGTALIEEALTYELGARVVVEFRAAGLYCLIELPIESEPESVHAA